MELYHNDMAICSQKVRLVLIEKQLAPVLHHLDLRAGNSHSPEYLKINPKGVVPTLVDHDNPITESTVICEYLDDAYPEIPLRPRDSIERAAMRRWTMLPDTGLHTAERRHRISTSGQSTPARGVYRQVARTRQRSFETWSPCRIRSRANPFLRQSGW